MNKRNYCALLAAVLLLAGGCAQKEETSGFLLYYQTRGEQVDQTVEGVNWSGDTPDLADVDSIFHQLSRDPEELELCSVIPAGTEIQGISLEDGILSLDLSGEYSTLSGVEQTIANSCIALTYCQMKEVEGVEITSDGEAMSDGILTKDAMMLDGGEGDTGQLEIRLYYPMTEGTDAIGFVTDRLTVTEDHTPVETVLQGLCDGPESRQLQSFLPSRMSGVTLWTEEGVCYVNLTSDWVEELESGEVELSLALRCITNSLCELDSVSSVQFLMDGAVLNRWADVGGDFPLLPDTSSCVDIERQ